VSEFVPVRFHAVLAAPAWMDVAERALLYGLVAAREPRRVLELRTQEGGATAILCAALDDLGSGRIITVDPEPSVAGELWAMLEHRTTQVATVEEALATIDDEIDLVLLYHQYVAAEVVEAVDALSPRLAPGAHVLVHDAHLGSMRDAVQEILRRHEGAFVDAGLLATATTEERRPDGDVTRFGGLRLLYRPGL
jgi:predicted O-methyltransferase YrrM